MKIDSRDVACAFSAGRTGVLMTRPPRGRPGPGRKGEGFVPLRDTASLDPAGNIGSGHDILEDAG